jgi:hypothetical protein
LILSAALSPSNDIRAWEDIEIVFLCDERVDISDGISRETRNYAELGFADQRSGKPNLAWVMLRDLAEGRGIIRDAATTDGWSMVERRMLEIRKTLRKHFGIATCRWRIDIEADFMAVAET